MLKGREDAIRPTFGVGCSFNTMLTARNLSTREPRMPFASFKRVQSLEHLTLRPIIRMNPFRC